MTDQQDGKGIVYLCPFPRVGAAIRGTLRAIDNPYYFCVKASVRLDCEERVPLKYFKVGVISGEGDDKQSCGSPELVKCEAVCPIVRFIHDTSARQDKGCNTRIVRIAMLAFVTLIL